MRKAMFGVVSAVLVVGLGFMGSRAFCAGEVPKEILDEVKNPKEIPAGTYAKVNVYEAEALQHQENRGKDEADPQASGKKCFVSNPDENEQGHAISGPYEVLEPGKYVAFFRIKLLQDAPDELVVTIDASADFGVSTLESREVLGVDLKKDKYVQVPLIFEYSEGKVETRVLWGGSVKVAIDCITLFKIK